MSNEDKKFNLFLLLKEKILSELDQFRLLSDSMYYMTGDPQFKENIVLAIDLCAPIKSNEIDFNTENIQILKRLAFQMKGNIPVPVLITYSNFQK